MRTLVTGSSGMVGSNIVELLQGKAIEPLTADLVDGSDLRNIFAAEIAAENIVYDCAAPTRGIGCQDFSDAAVIPMNLLAWKPARFIYMSSSCVYPDSIASGATETWGFTDEPESANQGYGWAKRAGELACRYSGVPCTIVRPSNIYGPSYNWANPIKHVIPSLIERMLNEENPLTVWGSGKQTRSFMYESDCAALMIALSGYEWVFNLGGHELEIGELARLLAGIVGFKGQIKFDTSKPEGPKRKSQSTAKLESVLGKVASISLEDGLRRTVIAAQRNHRTLQPAN